MKHIKMDSITCSGCKACSSVCGKNAITFHEDKEGFQIPIVDIDKCINCGLCVSTCPALSASYNIRNDYKLKAYALQYLNYNIRKKSASGGLFPAFAYYFIEKLNGYVCGCILDKDLVARHIVSNCWNDIERMQDSKYVQSDMGSCICDIIGLLKQDRYVLFSGTSCQVMGLISALKSRHIDRSKLLTIDFFCHGVPSPMVWRDYIKLYNKKSKKKIEGFRFRNKTYGWGKGKESRGASFLSSWLYDGKYHEDTSLLARIWPRIFFSNLCLRSYCHRCPYSQIDKPADITMGDFWGIEFLHPTFDDHKGCSLAIIHNMKAEIFLNKLENIQLLEVTIDEIIKKQGNAFSPSQTNEYRTLFWQIYEKKGIKGVLPYFFGYTLKGRVKAFLKIVLFKLHLIKYQY